MLLNFLINVISKLPNFLAITFNLCLKKTMVMQMDQMGDFFD